MQPEERKRGTTEQGVARARVLLKKNMGWLPGYPMVGAGKVTNWWTLPTGGEAQSVVLVDRERLRRMEMTLSKLRHHFPTALPKVVEDVDDWLRRMDFLLVKLKEGVHRQGRMKVEPWFEAGLLPRRWSDAFQALWKKQKALQPLLHAIFFLETTGVRRPSLELLDWVAQHAAALLKISELPDQIGEEKKLELQLLFVLLQDQMDPALQSVLFECFAESCSWSLRVDDSYHYAQQLSEQLVKGANQNEFQIPERPLPSLCFQLMESEQTVGELLYHLLHELVQLKPKTLRSVSSLLGFALPSNLGDRVRAEGVHVASEEARLLGKLKQMNTAPLRQLHKKAERKKLKDFATVTKNVSKCLNMKELKESFFSALSLSKNESLSKVWSQFLGKLPETERNLRQRLFVHWERDRNENYRADRSTQQFQHILTQVTQMIRRRGVSQVILSHWLQYAQSKKHGVDEFVIDLFDEEVSNPVATRSVHLLEEVVYVRGVLLKNKHICLLLECAKATPDLQRAADVVAELVAQEDEVDEKDQWYGDNQVHAALSLTDDNREAVRIIKIISQSDDAYDMSQRISFLKKHIQDNRLLKVIVRLIVEKNEKLLTQLATSTQLVIGFDCTMPQLPNTTTPLEWVNRYPSALHEVLWKLCLATEDAPVIAEGLLGKDFPQEDRLQQEMVAIREKLEVADEENSCQNLTRRLRNLESRINSPPTVSPDRLANLAKRIQGRVDHQIVQQTLDDCRQLVVEQLKSRYSIEELPEELFQSPYDQLLPEILKLNGRAKKLGLRLLFDRFSKHPSDFTQESANVAFVEKMTAKGIEMEPWLSGAFSLDAKSKDGELYTLRFTHDAIDYLLMGFHFGTCLSPDDFNFFSTIANAVDINKQVVYGKTSAGKIIGRCLFALTNEGTILTYHRYSHDAASSNATKQECFVPPRQVLLRALK